MSTCAKYHTDNQRHTETGGIPPRAIVLGLGLGLLLWAAIIGGAWALLA